jgi:hypothetical protein
MPNAFPDRLYVKLLPAKPRRFPHWSQHCSLVFFWLCLCTIFKKRRRRWKLLKSFHYVPSWAEGPFDEEVVPKGFIIDGASIPCLFWRLIGPPMGPYAEASAVHDYLWVEALRRNCDFSYANLVFRDAMKQSGIWAWRYWLMWFAVTLNGWKVKYSRRLLS